MRNDKVNNALSKTISADRLGKYLALHRNDLSKALDLYEENTRLAEAFYTPLQCLEVCLRNVIHDEIARTFGPNWFTNGGPPLQPDSDKMIREAIEELKVPHPSPGAIVAELKFGFWVGMLGKSYDATLWRQSIFKAFKASGTKRRSEVHGRFNAIRRFRNRVAHHEPIFEKDLAATHEEIVEAISWMCKDTAAWAKHHSRVQGLLGA